MPCMCCNSDEYGRDYCDPCWRKLFDAACEIANRYEECDGSSIEETWEFFQRIERQIEAIKEIENAWATSGAGVDCLLDPLATVRQAHSFVADDAANQWPHGQSGPADACDQQLPFVGGELTPEWMTAVAPALHAYVQEQERCRGPRPLPPALLRELRHDDDFGAGIQL